MQIQPPKTIEEAIKLLLWYVGITKLTKENLKKVYLRSKQLQVIMQQGGFWEGRMPYLEELEAHIGFESEAPMTHDDKKWDKVLVTEITNIAKQWQEQEQEHLAKQDLEEKTINEENEEASKQLEEISQEEPKEEKEKYPY
jgi:hypothetical protein|tara:strand:+ start:810 stop:1232 length:423 start_codon:yes stop_codon:yes gene_type:complete